MTNAYPSIEKKSPYNKCTPTPVQQHPKPHLVNKVDMYTSQPSDCSQPSSINSHTKDPHHKKLQQWEKDLKVSVNSEKLLLLDIVSGISVVMLCELCYFG